MQISHEAIYRSLFIQTRGVLKKELTAQLRTAPGDASPQEPQREEWTGAYPRYGSPSASGPPRLRIAPCRGIGKETFLPERTSTHIATLVERNTRFTMLVKIPRKDTTTVVAALAEHIGKLPDELRRSLT